MKVLDWLEYGGLNMITISVIGWLTSLLGIWSTIIAILVGVSVCFVNYAKYKSIVLENKLKEQKIKENEEL